MLPSTETAWENWLQFNWNSHARLNRIPDSFIEHMVAYDLFLEGNSLILHAVCSNFTSLHMNTIVQKIKKVFHMTNLMPINLVEKFTKNNSVKEMALFIEQKTKEKFFIRRDPKVFKETIDYFTKGQSK